MFMLGDFIRVLRAADIRVSTAESLDAANAVQAIGLDDRALLKHALGHALAKSDTEKTRFDECFESYFNQAQFAPPPPDSSPPDSDDQAQDNTQAQTDNNLEAMLATNDQAALSVAMMEAATQAELREARLFTQQGIFTRRIVEAMGIGALEESIREARLNGDAERMSALEQSRARLLEEVRDYVERQIAMRTANAGRLVREDALSRMKLSNLDQSDMKLMREIIRKLAKRLASRHAHRRKKARRGVLDLRRTIRVNQANDGVLFDLVWRRKKVERPKLIVVCDVSGSVAAVARFLLMFLYELGEVMPRTRSFAFSNRLGEVSAVLETQTAEIAMTDILRTHGGGTTDYGVALRDLADLCLDDIDHRTTLLMLGDARSNFGDPGHLILKEMFQRARRVVWLNPEVKALWNTGDSEMKRLGAYCTHVQVCNCVRHLETVLDDLLRAAI